MARAGRKRKAGKRHPSGQLVRTPARDKGTPELQMQRLARSGSVPAASKALWVSEGAAAALAGTMPNKAQRSAGVVAVPGIKAVNAEETIDPIGRAWAAGLLDADEAVAQELRDAGRRFSILYWRKLPGTSQVSSLYAKMVSGLIDELPAGVDREAAIEDAVARDRRQENALNRIIAGLDRLGRPTRRAVDALVLDPFADAGPSWLDWLIHARASVIGRTQRAVAGSMMVSTAHASAGNPSNATLGMFLPAPTEDIPVTLQDWHLFLPSHELLRWSDTRNTLSLALMGLRTILHGKTA